MSQYASTAEVYAEPNIMQGGMFVCPMCGRSFSKKREFGHHLRSAHGIKSARKPPKTDVQPSPKVSAVYPVHVIQYCPHCGFYIDQLEQAVALLKAR